MTVQADEETPLLQGPHDLNPNRIAGANHGVQPLIGDDRPKASMLATMLPLSIGIFLAALDWTIVTATYASIGSELNELQSTSWIATAYMLTTTSFQPLYGKLSDIFGRKACLIFAYVTFSIGCLLCGLSRNMTELIAARALAGVGGGGMTTLASIIMSDVAPLRQRGTWQGVANIVFATGQATGAPIGGLLADTIGWRWAFLSQVPLTLLAIISVSLSLTIHKAPDSNLKDKFKRIDFAGATSLVLAVFFLLLGLDRGGNVSWHDKFTITYLALFGFFSVLFGFIEVKVAKEPFAPKRIVFNRSLIASYLCNFFSIAAVIGLLFHVSLWFQAVKAFTASQAGLVLLPSIASSVMGSLGGGLIMQATGKYYALTVTALLVGFAGCLVVALMTGVLAYSYVVIIIGLFTMGLGNGTAITSTLISLIACAGPEDQAIATAVSYLFRSLGGVVGVSVTSTITQDNLRSQLLKRLSGENVDEIIDRVRKSLTSIHDLDPAIRVRVIDSYDTAIHIALWVCVAGSGLAAISSWFIKEKALTK